MVRLIPDTAGRRLVLALMVGGFCLLGCDAGTSPPPVPDTTPPRVVTRDVSRPAVSGVPSLADPGNPSAPDLPGNGAGDGQAVKGGKGPAMPKARTGPGAGHGPVTTERLRQYDFKGRIDPFLPLLTVNKEPETVTAEEDARPKRVLTPLEKMDLSQVKLVAVIQLKGRSIAMVEEASGKGYEVKLGTYIGKNRGQVSAIHADSIVVKEIVKDFRGKRRERFQEIKFHKEEGGS